MFKSINFSKVVWPTSLFLIGTLLISLTLVPWYLWNHGLHWFHAVMFLIFFNITGLSITLGYHRLYSHQTFKAKLPVRLFTLLFGAAAFENSAYWWSAGHRKHHQHCDHEDDPYDISKGFMWAHMGWLMFKLKPLPPIDNVRDLEKDSLVMWQHRHVHLIAIVMGVLLPTAIGGLYFGSWTGALGGFLIPGVLRIVCVQHATFFINSLCHCVGNRPYSKEHSARDSWFSALFTFGEGYHNYHHTFANDYRNGIRPWQWDPTKWTIWLLSKVGLASNLRVVPEEKILLAEMKETQRLITEKLSHKQAENLSARAKQALEDARQRLSTYMSELQDNTSHRIAVSKDKLTAWRKELSEATKTLESFTA